MITLIILVTAVYSVIIAMRILAVVRLLYKFVLGLPLYMLQIGLPRSAVSHRLRKHGNRHRCLACYKQIKARMHFYLCIRQVACPQNKEIDMLCLVCYPKLDKCPLCRTCPMMTVRA